VPYCTGSTALAAHNDEIAGIFNAVADLREIQGANEFRVRAYRKAARTIQGLSQSVAEMLSQGQDLSGLSGIGKDLAGKIEAIVTTGTLGLLTELQGQMPAGLLTLMRVPGLGPKRVAALHQRLGITTLDDLRQAAEQGRIQTLEGFGQARRGWREPDDVLNTRSLQERKRLLKR
jgi:DNA polymerase (family 10)